jgi:hypothetical protein
VGRGEGIANRDVDENRTGREESGNVGLSAGVGLQIAWLHLRLPSSRLDELCQNANNRIVPYEESSAFGLVTVESVPGIGRENGSFAIGAVGRKDGSGSGVEQTESDC